MRLDRFIKRPVLSTVISIVIVILGILGLLFLPVTQYPDIAPPTIQVSTSYTGANAQTILNSVIAPLEESINARIKCSILIYSSCMLSAFLAALFSTSLISPDWES